MIHKKCTRAVVVLLVAWVGFLFVPIPKFDEPYSTVLVAKGNELLGAKTADDGQWRFPATNTYSDKYVRCVLQYEDKYFFYHPGFNPVSFVTALVDNIKHGTVVRGGSTITMQVVRLARKNKPRTYAEKLLETILAMRLELRYSKSEIFAMYAAHAPFGGNVVGIDAAAWRYFGTSPSNLSWSEAAMLAVLPNSPSLVNVHKNRSKLLEKRNNLLKKLSESKNTLLPRMKKTTVFSYDDYDLSLLENIPDKPYMMPQDAYHYLSHQERINKGTLIHSDIDFELQCKVNQIVSKHYKNNSINGIENCCVYVYDYLDSTDVCYVGNVLEAKNSAMVDMVRAQRSTGSILKPFLYAAMLDEGALLPEMVLPDIPMNIAGYTPKNYSGEFAGAVNADVALSHSLNAPFVYLLRKYGVGKFYDMLKRMNITGLVYPADHYGLSLILGGGETSVYDVTRAYGNMASELTRRDYDFSGKDNKRIFGAEAIYLTFKAMEKVNRPLNQTNWNFFSSSGNVAWKTGTSFGFKDAWSVGIVDKYVIGVWVGNSDGEGRPGLTGVNVAAPILFDVIEVLNKQLTLDNHNCNFMPVEVCALSGYPKSEYCPNTKWIDFNDSEIMTGVCPYHKKVFLDKTGQYRVNAQCYDVDAENFGIYYVLTPTMEWFYKKINPTYKSLPPLLRSCMNSKDDKVMSFIYPEEATRILIPVGLHGDKQSVIFEIAHRNPHKKIYWNLNEDFLGTTQDVHQMSISCEVGKYTLRCTDEDGNVLVRYFEVVDNQKNGI